MTNDRPDPGEFLEMAQRMMRQLFGDSRSDDEPDGGTAGSAGRSRTTREPSPERQRENLTFALATRAVEALVAVALNVAAIRQRLERLERLDGRGRDGNPPSDGHGGDGTDAPGT